MRLTPTLINQTASFVICYCYSILVFWCDHCTASAIGNRSSRLKRLISIGSSLSCSAGGEVICRCSIPDPYCPPTSYIQTFASECICCPLPGFIGFTSIVSGICQRPLVPPGLDSGERMVYHHMAPGSGVAHPAPRVSQHRPPETSGFNPALGFRESFKSQLLGPQQNNVVRPSAATLERHQFQFSPEPMQQMFQSTANASTIQQQQPITAFQNRNNWPMSYYYKDYGIEQPLVATEPFNLIGQPQQQLQYLEPTTSTGQTGYWSPVFPQQFQQSIPVSVPLPLPVPEASPYLQAQNNSLSALPFLVPDESQQQQQSAQIIWPPIDLPASIESLLQQRPVQLGSFKVQRSSKPMANRREEDTESEPQSAATNYTQTNMEFQNAMDKLTQLMLKRVQNQP